MSTTGTESPRDGVPEQAVGYEDNDRLLVAPEIRAVRPSGAFFSTVGDLAKWDAALQTSDVLTEATRREMWERVTLNDGTTDPWGLGWQLGELFDRRMVHHWGGMIGFRAGVAKFVDDGLTIIVLMNLSDVDIGTIVLRLARHYLRLEQPPANLPKERPWTPPTP